MHWALQDLEFLSPLLGVAALVLGIRWAEKRLANTTPKVHDLPPLPDSLTAQYANPGLIGTESKPAPHVANDWGIRLTNLMNNMTQDGFVALLDDERDEIIIAPQRRQWNNSPHCAKVHAKSDGTGWELK